MNNGMRSLFSAGLGAAAMYYLDPARGRYRRALVRDQLVHAAHKTNHGIEVVGRDTRNRAIGVTARMKSLLDRNQPDDTILVERVRACLGRVVSHPHSIHVAAQDGVVTLSGPILNDEVPLLVDCTLRVSGVRSLNNRLDARAEPGHIPGLQGTPRQRPGTRSAFMQTNWSPAARAAGGLTGAMAAMWGFGQRNSGGTLIGTAGLLLLGRAATNLEMRRLIGIGVPRHAVDVQKC
ncbi:MAG TPA: BON domain-containing protein, partial [Woeseiaceae bacterium]|nr:BON domain-containing protein [Woeseiaceae bacterium]